MFCKTNHVNTVVLTPLVTLLARVYMAHVFWQSGMTKISSWDSTLFLFEHEYALPLLPYKLAAYMGTGAELVLPVLLVLGLGTRFAALGLLAMTLVIELLVYPGTTEHIYWLLIFAWLTTQGGGRWSVDTLLAAKCKTCKQ